MLIFGLFIDDFDLEGKDLVDEIGQSVVYLQERVKVAGVADVPQT